MEPGRSPSASVTLRGPPSASSLQNSLRPVWAEESLVLPTLGVDPPATAAEGLRDRHLATTLLWPLNRLHASGGIRPKRRRVPLRRREPVADGPVIAVRLSS